MEYVVKMSVCSIRMKREKSKDKEKVMNYYGATLLMVIFFSNEISQTYQLYDKYLFSTLQIHLFSNGFLLTNELIHPHVWIFKESAPPCDGCI